MAAGRCWKLLGLGGEGCTREARTTDILTGGGNGVTFHEVTQGGSEEYEG